MDWPLAEAKNKLSEVFEKALTDGPQRIVRRGKASALLISEADYRRLTGRKKPDFIQFLLSAPSFDGLDIKRDKTPLREIEL